MKTEDLSNREKDIQILCEGVLNATPNVAYHHNGDTSSCPFCSAELRYDEWDISKLIHHQDCCYFIAKDLSTGFRNNI